MGSMVAETDGMGHSDTAMPESVSLVLVERDAKGQSEIFADASDSGSGCGAVVVVVVELPPELADRSPSRIFCKG